MRRPYFLVIFLLIFSTQCQVPHVQLAGTDPDIVLINIENGDRVFISRILSKIDSLKPAVVGIDVFFQTAQNPKQDSPLVASLRKLKNEFLIFNINNEGDKIKSLPVFTKETEGDVLLDFETMFGLVSNMRPIAEVKNEIHESFALKLAKRFNPGLKIPYETDEFFPIDYTRTLNQFLHINGSDLINTPVADFDLANKIILVGFIGPGNEDKYKTPLRLIEHKKIDQNQPDTYGLVIIANQIRTLLGERNKMNQK